MLEKASGVFCGTLRTEFSVYPLRDRFFLTASSPRSASGLSGASRSSRKVALSAGSFRLLAIKPVNQFGLSLRPRDGYNYENRKTEYEPVQHLRD